jgi:hypothetical protein
MVIDAETGTTSQLADGNNVHTSFVLPNSRVLITNGDGDNVALANGATGAIEARRFPNASLLGRCVSPRTGA